MVFAQARDSEFPPYLLDFRGTPGERHVENLKVRMGFFRDDQLNLYSSRYTAKLVQPHTLMQSGWSLVLILTGTDILKM